MDAPLAKNKEKRTMENRLIVTYDKSSEDTPVLVVGRENSSFLVPQTIISKVITGDHAAYLYAELTEKKQPVNVKVGAVISKTHELKLLAEFFLEVMVGVKSFELRKDDREYAVGDTLIMREYIAEDEHFTGRVVKKRIVYILRNCEEYGLMPGYCILGLGELT